MHWILVEIRVKNSIKKIISKILVRANPKPHTSNFQSQTKTNSAIKPTKWRNLSQLEISMLLFKIKNHCPSPTTDLDMRCL